MIYLFDEAVGAAVMPLRVSRPLRKDIMVNFTYEDLIATGKVLYVLYIRIYIHTYKIRMYC